METLNHSLWLANIVLLVALAIRLVRVGLHTRYRAFFFWVCFQAARNAVLEILSGYETRTQYFYFWVYSEPVLVITFVVAVFEIYSLSLQRYKNLSAVSAKMLMFALVVASLISVLSILPDLQFNAAPKDDWFLLTNVIRRGVYTSLFAFLVLLVSFITIFPVKLSRNTIVHVGLFSVVFVANAATIVAMNFEGYDVIPTVNAISGAVAAVSFACWIVLVSPAGERVERTVRSNLSRADAQALLEKLEAISSSADRSRKII